MSDTHQLSKNLPKNLPPLPHKIPITYLWFGKEVPEDYLISLAELNYPVQFLKNPYISRNFTREILDIEKSDYYRLQHLYDYGGIYSDFDNVIDYECLMKLIQPYRSQDKLVFMTNPKHNRKQMNEMTNNLIFAPYAGMPILKTMLDSVDEKKGKIWGFAGMKFVARFKQPLEVNMDKCVKHTGDWSWVDASNEVLHRKNKPHSNYKQKLVKKKYIMAENSKLSSQIKSITSTKNRIRKQLLKMKVENKKLRESMDLVSTKFSNQVINQLKVQDQYRLGRESSDMKGEKDKRIMEVQVEYLTERSEKLEADKDVMLVVSGVGVGIVLVLMVIGVILLRKRKSSSFNSIVQTSRNITEEH